MELSVVRKSTLILPTSTLKLSLKANKNGFVDIYCSQQTWPQLTNSHKISETIFCKTTKM